MDTQIVVPVFPLSIAPLPGEPVPLYIFEEKYKEMLTFCAAGDSKGRMLPFAIHCALDEGLSVEGCLMRIERVMPISEDGRSLLLTTGLCRSVLLDVFAREHSFSLVKVTVPEDKAESISAALSEEVISLARIIYPERIEGFHPLDRDEVGLSFLLAAHLDLEIEERLKLLSEEAEESRLGFMRNLLLYRRELIERGIHDVPVFGSNSLVH